MEDGHRRGGGLLGYVSLPVHTILLTPQEIGRVWLAGADQSANAPVQARRRVSADVDWNRLLGRFT